MLKRANKTPLTQSVPVAAKSEFQNYLQDNLEVLSVLDCMHTFTFGNDRKM